MSTRRLTIIEISCDLRIATNCDETTELGPGVDLSTARKQARDEGWDRGRSRIVGNRLLDICPKCGARLRGEVPEELPETGDAE